MDEARREQARAQPPVGTGDESRGLGWQLNTPENILGGSLKSYTHTGFTGTSLWIDPERDLVVACLTNRVYYGREKMLSSQTDWRRPFYDLFAGAVLP
jgi:CubicO group peptidase (beta-lactamase class C family)